MAISINFLRNEEQRYFILAVVAGTTTVVALSLLFPPAQAFVLGKLAIKATPLVLATIVSISSFFSYFFLSKYLAASKENLISQNKKLKEEVEILKKSQSNPEEIKAFQEQLKKLKAEENKWREEVEKLKRTQSNPKEISSLQAQLRTLREEESKWKKQVETLLAERTPRDQKLAEVEKRFNESQILNQQAERKLASLGKKLGDQTRESSEKEKALLTDLAQLRKSYSEIKLRHEQFIQKIATLDAPRDLNTEDKNNTELLEMVKKLEVELEKAVSQIRELEAKVETQCGKESGYVDRIKELQERVRSLEEIESNPLPRDNKEVEELRALLQSRNQEFDQLKEMIGNSETSKVKLQVAEERIKELESKKFDPKMDQELRSVKALLDKRTRELNELKEQTSPTESAEYQELLKTTKATAESLNIRIKTLEKELKEAQALAPKPKQVLVRSQTMPVNIGVFNGGAEFLKAYIAGEPCEPMVLVHIFKDLEKKLNPAIEEDAARKILASNIAWALGELRKGINHFGSSRYPDLPKTAEEGEKLREQINKEPYEKTNLALALIQKQVAGEYVPKDKFVKSSLFARYVKDIMLYWSYNPRQFFIEYYSDCLTFDQFNGIVDDTVQRAKTAGGLDKQDTSVEVLVKTIASKLEKPSTLVNTNYIELIGLIYAKDISKSTLTIDELVKRLYDLKLFKKEDIERLMKIVEERYANFSQHTSYFTLHNLINPQPDLQGDSVKERRQSFSQKVQP